MEEVIKQIQVVIDSYVHFDLNDFEGYQAVLRALKDKFSYANPAFNDPYQDCDDPYIKTYFESKGRIYFYRGGLKKILTLLNNFNLLYTTNDKRLVTKDFEYPWSRVTYREDQLAFINDIIKYKQGLALAYTSFGKSLSILGVAKELKQTIVIIVHTEFLQKQWIKEAINPKLFNLPKKYIGGCGGVFQGKARFRAVNICLYHSLSDPKYLKMFLNAGILVQDEVQKAPIEAVQDCIRHFPAKYRIGVTAQYKRKDGKEFITKDCFGEVIHIAEEKESDSKILSNITLVETNYYDYEYQWDRNFPGLITRASQDRDRNTLILKRALAKVRDDKQVLIFLERKEQAFLLAQALEKKGLTVGLLVGSVTKKNIDKFISDDAKKLALAYDHKKAYAYCKKYGEQKKLHVIIGTQKAEVGLSIRTLGHVIVTTPVGRSMADVKDRLNQMIGRVERTHDDELTKKFGVKTIPTVDILIDVDLPFADDMKDNIKKHYKGRICIAKRSI